MSRDNNNYNHNFHLWTTDSSTYHGVSFQLTHCKPKYVKLQMHLVHLSYRSAEHHSVATVHWRVSVIFYFFLFLMVVLVIELTISHMIGQGSTTVPQPSALPTILILWYLCWLSLPPPRDIIVSIATPGKLKNSKYGF
jgi:glucose-6-phosphate-specific signal transduction histidine kinase